ncbi:hypothetical protein [Clostridium sp.]
MDIIRAEDRIQITDDVLEVHIPRTEMDAGTVLFDYDLETQRIKEI